MYLLFNYNTQLGTKVMQSECCRNVWYGEGALGHMVYTCWLCVSVFSMRSFARQAGDIATQSEFIAEGPRRSKDGNHKDENVTSASCSLAWWEAISSRTLILWWTKVTLLVCCTAKAHELAVFGEKPVCSDLSLHTWHVVGVL